MSAWLLVAAIGLAAASGLPGLGLARSGRAGERLAAVLLAAAALLAIAGGLWSLLGHPGDLDAPWPVPGGRLRIRVDALAAIFAVPIALVSALGAVYGLGYWSQSEHPDSGRLLRACYGILTAGLLLVCVAGNVLLFFAGWEMMALAAFLLITTEHREAAVREVGYVYLLATRASTLCLFAMFGLLYAATGSLDFADWRPALAGPLRDAIFVTGLAGFGIKAGLMPLHVWLPGAHGSAPSHVSAQMSGVLIKIGVYGLIRITSLCDAPPTWWGIAVLVIGSSSALLGVAFAIGQHDLKRLLAYHSIENLGIICLGLGVALLGRALVRPELVALGLAGALLHVWNHGLFKSLLFLAAGAVVHATGTRELDRLGGLWPRMPWTGAAFLIGAVAICGLPPLNGLVSELFVYLGLFRAASGSGDGVWLIAMLAAAALAMVGALALACFVKAFGAIFLGLPRSEAGQRAREVGLAMRLPMAALAACCVALGVGAPLVLPLLDEAIAAWAGPGMPRLAAAAPVTAVAIASATLIAVLAVAAPWLARGRGDSADVGTWDCGHAAPSPRAQYTASSFASMLVQMFGWALRPERHLPALREPFPGQAAFASHVPDTVLDLGLRPLFGWIERAAGRLRRFQRGSIHAYLLYILATLIVLLLWRRP